VIRLTVMLYIRYPLSLRDVEDLLAQRGIDVSYEAVRYWWNRFGPMMTASKEPESHPIYLSGLFAVLGEQSNW